MLKTELELLRASRAQTLSRIEALSQAQIDFSPAPDKWSAGEIVHHLILSEEIARRDVHELIQLTRSGQRPLLERSFADFDIAPAFVPKSLLALAPVETSFKLFMAVFPDCLRDLAVRSNLFKAQHAEEATPTRGLPKADLCDGLSTALRETEDLFAANADLPWDRMIRRHPLSGTTTVPRAVRLLALHEQRHHDQIDAGLQHPRFPR